MHKSRIPCPRYSQGVRVQDGLYVYKVFCKSEPQINDGFYSYEFDCEAPLQPQRRYCITDSAGLTVAGCGFTHQPAACDDVPCLPEFNLPEAYTVGETLCLPAFDLPAEYAVGQDCLPAFDLPAEYAVGQDCLPAFDLPVSYETQLCSPAYFLPEQYAPA